MREALWLGTDQSCSQQSFDAVLVGPPRGKFKVGRKEGQAGVE